MAIREHYFNSMIPYLYNASIEDYLRAGYTRDRAEDIVRQNNELNKEQSFRKKFVELALKNLQDYHLFIVTNTQLKKFKELMAEDGLDKYFVYQSPKPAHNHRYPSYEPKLHCFILKLPEDFKVE